MIKRNLRADKAITVYDDSWKSLTEMVRDSKSIGMERWFGNTQDELVGFMEKGDKETVRKARAKFGEFINALMPEQMDLIPDRDRSVVGSVPCVPALLAGHPASMYRDVWEEGPGLCRIYVQGNCYAGVTSEMMLNRGIACAALAYAVQTTRPVELYWFALNSSMGEKHQLSVVRLPTAPLDLDRAGTVMSRVGIFRHSMTRGPKMFGGYSKRAPDTVFDLTPQDVIIPAVTHLDVPSVKKDALAWVKFQLENQAQARLSTTERGGRSG